MNLWKLSLQAIVSDMTEQLTGMCTFLPKSSSSNALKRNNLGTVQIQEALNPHSLVRVYRTTTEIIAQ